MDDSRAGPAEQRRHDQAHALTRAGGGECHDVLGPVVTKVSRTKPPEDHAPIVEQPGACDVLGACPAGGTIGRSEEHTSELQSLMRISYAVFCLIKKKNDIDKNTKPHHNKHISNLDIHK